MKTLRQQNRPIITYTPRVEPAPPKHAWHMPEYRDVWVLSGKYVAFVLSESSFLRSPNFEMPQAAQRWADQVRQDHNL
ncbi:cell division activator CedA [Salmonella enterica subsp. enterica serovar Choleraesuis]|nr:cell division activator CedA [Salmonella enterica subsp. enterica serovar Choleraesuis]